MKRHIWSIWTGLFAACALAAAGTAQAAAHDRTFRVCNNSGSALYFYAAYHGTDSRAGGLTTEGVAFLYNGDCSNQITRAVTADDVYIYAQVNPIRSVETTGDQRLCVDSQGTKVVPNADQVACDARDQIPAYFRPLDGLSLTGDTYKVAATDVVHRDRTMNVCNDTREEMIVAAAFEDASLSNDLISRGWTSILAGECSLVAVTTGRVAYIRAESATSDLVFGGDQQLCLNSDRYFTYAQGTRGPCSDAGAKRLGFFPVNLMYQHLNLVILNQGAGRLARVRVAPSL